MKKFLYICFSCFSIVFGICWAIQNRLDNVGREHSSQMNFVQQANIDADLLVFGNSRAQCSYNTQIMDSILGLKCCNLGLSGYPFAYQYKFMIEPYLKKNKKPSIIIQEVTTHAFLHHWNSQFSYNFLPFVGYADEYEYYVNSCDEVTEYDKYLPFKYRGIRYDKLIELYKDWSIHTPRVYNDGYTPLSDTMRYVNDFLTDFYPLEQDTDMVNMLSSFIHYCDNNDIDLFLVISPMHMEHYYKYCDMQGFYSLIDSLRDGTNAKFLNYCSMFGSDTIMLKNATHMSYTGSCIFSKKVSNDIKSLLYDSVQ